MGGGGGAASKVERPEGEEGGWMGSRKKSPGKRDKKTERRMKVKIGEIRKWVEWEMLGAGGVHKRKRCFNSQLLILSQS